MFSPSSLVFLSLYVLVVEMIVCRGGLQCTLSIWVGIWYISKKRSERGYKPMLSLANWFNTIYRVKWNCQKKKKATTINAESIHAFIKHSCIHPFQYPLFSFSLPLILLVLSWFSTPSPSPCSSHPPVPSLFPIPLSAINSFFLTDSFSLPSSSVLLVTF